MRETERQRGREREKDRERERWFWMCQYLALIQEVNRLRLSVCGGLVCFFDVSAKQIN